MNTFQSLAALLGRICIGLLFLWAGVAKLQGLEGTMAYMASKHMPFISFFLPAAIAIQVLGALSLITGYYARWGAAMLIIFIIPASIIFHDFWNLEGSERLTEMIMFMKDVGVLGGLLGIVAFGPGKYALNSCIRCHPKDLK
jgi:putative oxidoreductase